MSNKRSSSLFKRSSLRFLGSVFSDNSVASSVNSGVKKTIAKAPPLREEVIKEEPIKESVKIPVNEPVQQVKQHDKKPRRKPPPKTDDNLDEFYFNSDDTKLQEPIQLAVEPLLKQKKSTLSIVNPDLPSNDEKNNLNVYYGLTKTNSHQSFIQEARKSTDKLDELLDENHVKLRAEHDFMDRQLLLLSPKNRSETEHENLKRRSKLFYGDEDISEQLKAIGLEEANVSDQSLPGKHYSSEYDDFNNNHIIPIDSLSTNFTDAKEYNSSQDFLNDQQITPSPPAANLLTINTDNSRSRGFSVGQKSVADTIIMEKTPSPQDSDYPKPAMFRMDDEDDGISYDSEKVEPLNIRGGISPLLNHIPTLKADEDDYDEDEDNLNFTARSAVYDPYAVDQDDEPRQMRVANNVSDDEGSGIRDIDEISSDEDENDHSEIHSQVSDSLVDYGNSDSEENNLELQTTQQDSIQPSNLNFDGFSQGYVPSEESFPSNNDFNRSNTNASVASATYDYTTKPGDVRNGKLLGSVHRRSNPHLPTNIYDPVEKLTKSVQFAHRTSGASETINAASIAINELNQERSLTPPKSSGSSKSDSKSKESDITVAKTLSARNSIISSKPNKPKPMIDKLTRFPGQGQPSSYVKRIRDESMSANSTVPRKWRLPIGIRPVKTKDHKRSLNTASRIGHHSKDIKHISLQPRLLATGDDEDDDEGDTGEGIIITPELKSVNTRISFDGTGLNVKTNEPKITKEIKEEEVEDDEILKDSDDEDLFAEFADDINAVKKQQEEELKKDDSDIDSVDYKTGSPIDTNKFENINHLNNMGYEGHSGGGLFIANPDSD